MQWYIFISGLISGLLTSGFLLPALSQVTSDGTTNTTINQSGNNFNILNGTQKGNNLFHSFEEFSIPTGSSATFNNSTNVENIINRVTGGNISNIDGLIKANGNANLFLINPSGIVFGENAALNIGGSFFATTADSIVFPDNIEFNATNTDESPLLSINVPLGIQFGSNAATIINRSQTIDSDPTSPVGLQVKPGKSITLLGGKIEFDNGQLTASGGGVNLGAVAPDSFVSITNGDFGWILGYDKVNNFEDITLRANNLWADNIQDGNFFSDFDTEVDTSGERGGDIDVRGRQILFDGVSLLTGAQGLDAGKITINSSESLKFDSTSEEKYIFLVTQTVGLGNAGDIQINSPNIHIKSFANIDSSSGSYRLAISGDSNQGNAGNITINTDKFINEEGGIVSDSYGVGDGGNITLMAKEVILDGSKFDSRPIISSTNVGSANPGNIIITAERVSVNQGTIFASGFGAKPGEININVRNLELTNRALIINEFNTSILNPEFKESSGNITINASESVSISGHEIISYPEYESLFASGLSSTNNTLVTGNIVDNTGTIKVTTGHLKIFDGGQIVADTNATGNAGNIVIDADRIDISGSVTGEFGKKRAGIQTTANSEAIANAGNINIRTNNLRVFDGGSIASNALGISGNAGSISINAGNIDLEGVLSEQQLPSSISVFSQNDDSAGSVNITTDKINIRDRAEINVSNQGSGDSGNLNVRANNLFLDNSGSLQAEVNGGNQGNIKLNIEQLTLLRRGSSITTNATGASKGGNININSPVIAGFKNSDIIANAVGGDGGNIDITTQGLFGLERRNQLTNQSDITASSEFGIDGTVQINNVGIEPSSGLVELPELINTDVIIANSCVARSNRQNSTFYITGKAGFPYVPGEAVPSDYSMFEVGASSDNTSLKISASRRKRGDSIVEATGIYRLENGQQVIAREC